MFRRGSAKARRGATASAPQGIPNFFRCQADGRPGLELQNILRDGPVQLRRPARRIRQGRERSSIARGELQEAWAAASNELHRPAGKSETLCCKLTSPTAPVSAQRANSRRGVSRSSFHACKRFCAVPASLIACRAYTPRRGARRLSKTAGCCVRSAPALQTPQPN